MHNMRWLAESRYHFARDEIMIFSTVNPYLEQLDEIGQSFLSIVILNVEAVVFIAFFLLFDLRSIFLLALALTSCFTSILASMVYLGLSLNIVTLGHFIMMPAFLCEFFLATSYLFVFKSPKPERADRRRPMSVFLRYSKKSASRNAVGANDHHTATAAVNEPAQIVSGDGEETGGGHSNDATVNGEVHAARHNHVKTPAEMDEVSSILLVQSADEASLSNFPAANETAAGVDSSNEQQQQQQQTSSSKKSGRGKKFNRIRSLNLKRYGRSNLEQRRRLKKLKFVWYKVTKHTAFFLVCIYLISFVALVHNVNTYNFRSLYLCLISAVFNIFLHIVVFYPTLLCFFGTNWRYVEQSCNNGGV
jgi:hypothetical protein